MKRTLVFIFAMTFFFTGNVFCKDFDLNSFTDALLKNIQFSGTDEKSLTAGSKSQSSSQPTELSVVFEGYSLIYSKRGSNHILKYAYFDPIFLKKTFDTDFSKYTTKNFENFFSKPSIDPIESGFDTVGYEIKYKDATINLYLYFSKYNGKELQFIAFYFK